MTPSYKSRPKSLGSLSGNSFSGTFNKVKKRLRPSPLLKLKVCLSRQVNVVPPQAAAAKVTVLCVAVHLNSVLIRYRFTNERLSTIIGTIGSPRLAREVT